MPKFVILIYLSIGTEYKLWLVEVKAKIRSTQIKAAMAVNASLIEFYWELGKTIAEKQTAWGTHFLETLSRDLKTEFPDMEEFSKTNLYNIRRLYQFYANDEFFHQLGGKIPWRHHVEIFTKAKTTSEAFFYIQQTIENDWSRDILSLKIKSELYHRQGKIYLF